MRRPAGVIASPGSLSGVHCQWQARARAQFDCSSRGAFSNPEATSRPAKTNQNTKATIANSSLSLRLALAADWQATALAGLFSGSAARKVLPLLRLPVPLNSTGPFFSSSHKTGLSAAQRTSARRIYIACLRLHAFAAASDDSTARSLVSGTRLRRAASADG